MSQSLGFWRMRIGLGLVAIVVVTALAGPALAPKSPTAFAGPPFQGPTTNALLGTDYLGHDVLSNLLAGGRIVVWMSFATATLAVAVGAAIGMAAGYSRSRLDDLLMRSMDVLLALPAIVLVLAVVSLMGSNPWLVVAAVAWTWVPAVARLVRGVTVEVVRREHIEAVEVLGLPTWRIATGEILPNIATPIMVDYGVRLTWAIGVIAALSFIGAGVQPPNADWGLMINQNRTGLTQQPWAVLAPVLLIGIYALGTNMVAEGIARTASLIDRNRGNE